MALSIDSIYKPLNDFFLNRFKTSEENPVFFRFAKIGRIISDSDFIDSRLPGQYSPALAREYFSDLVNNIPIEDPDGQNIFFTQNNIDEMYHDRLLGPAVPFIPPDADAGLKENILNSFNQIKADALKDWNNIRAESSTGLMMDFKPSLASPDNWYDKTKEELWTPYSFHTEESTTPSPSPPQKFQLWKMRLNETQLVNAIPALNTSEPVKPSVLAAHPSVIKPTMFRLATTPATASARTAFKPAARLMTTVATAEPATRSDIDTALADATIPVRKNFHNAFWGMNVKNRLLVSQFIKTQAPTEPVNANSFSINFKYCVIDINRPWLKTSFINDRSWYIPNTPKGQLTASDQSGGTISVLPIAFIAIKQLSIEANWSNTDIEISKNATDFGPFEVDSEIVNNKLSHEGIQIVGWILQRMPGLPPNDAQV